MSITKAELEAEVAELREKVAAQESAPTGPHVMIALKNILATLAVKKNGQLPQNMGGKPYISAVDLNYEVKEKFVEQGLVLIPNERVIEYKTLEVKGRMNTYLVIHGQYQIVSTVDGSSVTISGIGDGIAMGSAVTSNIASTNSLKNALLRTFMVTEQSAEDAAKNGPPEGDEKGQTNRDLAKAASAAKPKPAPGAGAQQQESDAKRKVREEFLTGDDPLYTRDQVNAVMDAVKKSGDFRGDQVFDEVYRRLSNGELA